MPFASPSAVLAGAIDVQFGGHFGAAEGQIELHAVFRRHARVFIGMEEERGRRFGGDLLFVRQALDQFRRGVLAEQIFLRTVMRERFAERDDRVAEDHEVGPAAYAVDRVGGVRVALVEVRAGGRGQMPAGRKAHDADFLRIDLPLLGVRPARCGSPAGRLRSGAGWP